LLIGFVFTSISLIELFKDHLLIIFLQVEQVER